MRPEWNDTNLLQAFRSGEPAAETALFQRFFRAMCLMAVRITGELPAAEDIVADAFVKMFDRRADFAGIENIKAFLYTSARNGSVDFVRMQKRHRMAHVRIAATQEQAAEGLETAEDLELLRIQLLQDIYEEIENLPPQSRQISKMIFYEKKSTEEIARELNIAPQTVRTHKARAIQLLKKQLLKDEKFNTLLSLTLLVQAVWENW